MTYIVRGLDPAPYRALFEAPPEVLAENLAEWREIEAFGGHPCRVTLEEAQIGERVLLINFVSLDKPTPFRASHAIYVRENAQIAAVYEDCLPDMLVNRTLGLRGFTEDGYLHHGALAAAGEAHISIGELLRQSEVAYVDIHAAGYGCFIARAERN